MSGQEASRLGGFYPANTQLCATQGHGRAWAVYNRLLSQNRRNDRFVCRNPLLFRSRPDRLDLGCQRFVNDRRGDGLGRHRVRVWQQVGVRG